MTDKTGSHTENKKGTKKTPENKGSIRRDVAEIAEELAKSEGDGKGDKECWAFVHHVLHRAKAASFWEFNKDAAEATAMSPWGIKADGPKRGYIVILKGTHWKVNTARRSPFGGLTPSNTSYFPKLDGKGHIGIVLRVSPKHIEIAQQNVVISWRGIKATQMSKLIIPITEDARYEASEHGKYYFFTLKHLGSVSYFKPVAMKDGKSPSSPTVKAKHAIK